ncbi:hypothetical protein LCGC14_1149370 [marine sediment metagenome]|uniref:Helix-turn-helix domain-containing protein n=1 Tax=marine sediment metagenome TaxID=412755 RepID=A0A0F9MJA6_9ZZZZ
MVIATLPYSRRSPLNHKWTDEERDIIRRDFKHTHASRLDLAQYLSELTGDRITEFAVAGQIAIMGIAKSDDRRQWTPKEDQRLRNLMHIKNYRVVARMMERSINSVVVRSKRLHISRRIRNGWYTKREVCEILAHDHHWVQRRIDSGALKASWHYDTRPQQLGGSAWHIDEKDLKEFICRYPEEIVGCNIDIIQVVDIIAGVIPQGY